MYSCWSSAGAGPVEIQFPFYDLVLLNLIKYLASLTAAIESEYISTYWYIILSVNIFSPELSFDYWCLPQVLTRIIKLIYSRIRNWSLNWWIFKAIKVEHELISTMRRSEQSQCRSPVTTPAPDVNSQNTINRLDGWARVISWLSRSKTQSTILMLNTKTWSHR